MLTGGAGSDTFVFHTGLGALNIDRITDYNVASDVIHLSAATFTALIPGALNGAAFTANAAGAAQDAQDRIIYETDTGHLYYDPDGTGSAARQHFATLSAGLAMTAGEFLVI